MFAPGSQIQSCCNFCEKLGPATLAYGPAPIGGGRTVKNVLRATCDQCGQVVAFPSEATPAIA